MNELALELLRQAQTLLAGLKAGGPQIRATRVLLARVEKELAGPIQPVGRRRGTGVRYIVEEIAGVELLTEIRATGSKPFRAGYEVFTAVVGVLASTAEPRSYEEVAHGVARLVVPEPGSHQVRMVLRFLLREKLIGRAKNRYGRTRAGASSAEFKQAAMKIWKRLAIQPDDFAQKL